ncbi:hypothetical protein BH11CYA1_BH11CYA1_16330 [soil metagenome]
MQGNFEVSEHPNSTSQQENQASSQFFHEYALYMEVKPSPPNSTFEDRKAATDALIRKDLEPCNPLFAVDAARALDTNNLAGAKKLLNDCGLANPDFFADLQAFQDFAQRVSGYENKNDGLNLNLKWSLGPGDVYNLSGMEIGEANW